MWVELYIRHMHLVASYVPHEPQFVEVKHLHRPADRPGEQEILLLLLKAQTGDRAFVSIKAMDLRSVRHVPYVNDVVLAARRENSAAWSDARACDVVAVSHKLTEFCHTLLRPEAHGFGRELMGIVVSVYMYYFAR